MTRKWDPEIDQYREKGKFAGNDNATAAGGMNAIAVQTPVPDPTIEPTALADEFDNWEGNSLDFSGPELQGLDDHVSMIDVTRDEDGTFHIESDSAPLHLNWTMGRHLFDEGLTEDNEEEVTAFTNRHFHGIDQFMKDNYRGQLGDNNEDMDAVTFDFEPIKLPADAMTDDILNTVWEQTDAVKITNEFDPGTFGSPDMGRALYEHLVELDEQTESAAGSYAYWMERDLVYTMDDMEASEDEHLDPVAYQKYKDDPKIAPETLKKIREENYQFLAQNHKLISEALEIEGRDQNFDMEQVAVDLYLTRNGNGTGFWDRGLGDVGEKLSTAARAMGEVDYYIGDDGMVYAQ